MDSLSRAPFAGRRMLAHPAIVLLFLGCLVLAARLLITPERHGAGVHHTLLSLAMRQATASGSVSFRKVPENASTQGWGAALQQAYEKGRPPLPTEDFFNRHDGLFTLWVGTGLATGKVFLGVPVDRLSKPFVVSEQYSTTDGETGQRHVPAQVFDRSVFAFRKSVVAPDSLELYRPPLHVRSAQPGTPAGRETIDGLSVGGLATFPFRRSPTGLLVMDAGPWVAAGFFIPLHPTKRPSQTQFINGSATPGHITLRVAATVELGNATRLSPEGILGVHLTVTVFGLADPPMQTRALDDRIGFFAAPFTFADAYSEDHPTSGAVITRWDLSRRGGHLDWYVDPSVPRANWPAVRAGVLMWNAAFEAAGYDGRADPVLRVHLPTDSDWPSDYAADDARFLAISFVPQEQPSAIGPSVYDPRTGELLWATVVLNDDVPRLSAAVHRRWLADDPLPQLPRNTEGHLNEATRNASTGAAMGHFTRITSDEFVAQLMAALVAHEIGHTLGLRHHFKASAVVPWGELVNASYIESSGLSASVMDYPERLLLLPSSQVAPQRYFGSPVVGAYDKAAIRYGYDRSLSSAGALDALAAAVAAEGYAVASDGDVGLDGLAILWDLSDNPLAAWMLAVRPLQERVRRLLAATAASPHYSAAEAGADVVWMLQTATRNLVGATTLVGGSTMDRRRGSRRPIWTSIDSAMQGAALDWVLAQIHPTEGLLSATTVAAWAPFLAEESEECRLQSVGCLSRSPMPVAELLHSIREEMLDSLIHPVRLGWLADSPAAAEGVKMDGGRNLTVAALLSAVTHTLVGEDWSALRDATGVDKGGSRAFVAEAVARWVARLTAAADGKVAPNVFSRLRAPPSVHSQAVRLVVAGELSRMADAIAAAAASAPDNLHLRGLQVATAPYRARSSTGG